MALDLSLVPDVVKPMAQPLTGGALPETEVGGIMAEARTLEELADALAEMKADDAGAVMRLLRDGLWQGAAKESFEQVFATLSGREGATGSPEALLDLLEQALRDEAKSLREHGVRMQHTEWMIYASLALLGAMIVRLLVWICVNGPAVLGLIQHHSLLTRVNIQTLKRLVLLNMLRFGVVMGGLDLGVQAAQQVWGDRETGDFDLESLALSAGSGALTGALFAGANAGLSRLLSRNMVYVASKAELAVRDRLVALGQSMYGQALLGGVTGTLGAVPGLALSGQLDAEHLGYTFISGVAGGLGVPASARVSYLPMLAVADLGPHPPTSDAPSGPGASPGSGGPSGSAALSGSGAFAGSGGPSGRDALLPGQGLPSAGPHQPAAAGHGDAGGSPAFRPDATTLVQHAPPEPRSGPDTVIDRPPPSEAGGGTLAPHRGDTIAGEVVQRRDTPLPAPTAERSPMNGAPAVRAEAVTPGDLSRASPLPATVPAVNAVAHVAETPSRTLPSETPPTRTLPSRTPPNASRPTRTGPTRTGPVGTRPSRAPGRTPLMRRLPARRHSRSGTTAPRPWRTSRRPRPPGHPRTGRPRTGPSRPRSLARPRPPPVRRTVTAPPTRASRPPRRTTRWRHPCTAGSRLRGTTRARRTGARPQPHTRPRRRHSRPRPHSRLHKQHIRPPRRRSRPFPGSEACRRS
ncbi:hypothetical protein ACFQ0B_45975 [Nonomuraea thailandensis]